MAKIVVVITKMEVMVINDDVLNDCNYDNDADGDDDHNYNDSGGDMMCLITVLMMKANCEPEC